jgi:sulfatase-like protein
MNVTRSFFTLPLYPSALTAAFVLGIWLQSSLDVIPLLRPLAIAIGAAAVVTAVPVLLMRDRHRGGAVAGIALVGILGGDDTRVLVLAAAGLAGVLLLVARERHFDRQLPWSSLTRLMNLVTIVLVAILVARAAGSMLAVAPPTAAAGERPSTPTAQLPDVIVLLLDAHGREDILADQYDEDVSGFLGALRDRGFYVSPRARSNYMNTQLTLASMFNMTHVSEINLPPQTASTYNVALRASLDRNPAFAALRAAGYHVGAVSPGYEGVALRSADMFLEGGQASELESVLIANSGLRHALTAFAPDALANQARERVLWNLEPDHWLPGVAPAATLARPYFLFVHVPSPHFPYLFDRTGGPVNDRPVVVTGRGTPATRSPAELDATAALYSAQLAYVDGLAIQALDEVIANVPTDAVIVVLGDHGPDAYIDWDHLETTPTLERFATLFAARTPGMDRLFGDGPTPVNLIPTLLNSYAGTTLPTHSDDSFRGYPPRQALTDIGNPDEASP